MRIYADNAATTKMSKRAIEAMTPYLEEIFGNPSSLYSAGQAAKEAIETYRAEIPGVIDQDLPAFVIAADGEPVGKMNDGDAVILYNFRGDRAADAVPPYRTQACSSTTETSRSRKTTSSPRPR